MKQLAKRWLRNAAGVLLILLGIVSGFLPILQGWLFIVIGLGLIEHPLKLRLHIWLSHRFACYRRLALLYFRARRRFRQRKLDRAKGSSGKLRDDKHGTVD